MRIELRDAGKRFNREWIFRSATLTLNPGDTLAITGPNGSGKSTLLQCLGGMLELSEGSLQFHDGSASLPKEGWHAALSYCAPYQELIEELTLEEFLRFHLTFKRLLPGLTPDSAIRRCDLHGARNKAIRLYSSGMKQRARLLQALLSDTPVVLLDEPTSNLDRAGIDLYHSLITEFTPGRTVVVCSNVEEEYAFCVGRLEVGNLKS